MNFEDIRIILEEGAEDMATTFDRVVSENPTSSVWDFKRLNYD